MGPFRFWAVAILLTLQAGGGSVVGTIRDAETGEPLAGATVVLSDVDRAVVTDDAGRYAVLQVPAGPQHVTVRLLGYASRSLHALVPRAGELEIHVALRRAPLRLPTVRVRAPVAVRGVEDSASRAFPDRDMSIAAVTHHPLLAEPEVFQALSGGEIVVSPEAPGGVHVRGAATDHTAYLLDGIPVFNPFHAAGVSSAWSPDALSGLRLSSVWPSASHPHALSGTVEAETRAPTERLRARGSLSTTQWRMALDGPLGSAGAGYVASVRSGVHDLIAPRDEASYLEGGTGDWLAKLELPVLGGRARVLGYGNANQIDAARVADSTGTRPVDRNRFEWHSRSFGAEWKGDASGLATRVLGWSATGETRARWAAPTAPVELSSRRHAVGLLASVERRAGRGSSALEVRFEGATSSYDVRPDSGGGSWVNFGGRTPVATASASHTHAIARSAGLDLGASVAWARRALHPAPRARVRWRAMPALELSGGYSRNHQFAQSLRNAESVVGHVFPADALVGAGDGGIPVARGDLGVIAADYRPLAGLRVGMQVYARRSRHVVLVAPRDGEPFSTGGFAIGSDASRGLSAELALSSARYGVLASYGWQRVRLQYGDSSYVPEHGTEHVLEGGVIVFPAAATSIRLGASAGIGRRTTTVPGGLEWESCNLLDQGCEFAGSPHYGNEPLGATRLPPYCRLDLGLRQHWHVGVGGRDGLVALFGTFTNVLGRKNLLTYARDASGETVEIELRPPAMLVVGIDWRF